MTITWSIEDLRADGVSLKNYGFGISLVGGLSGIPPRVGSNVPVAYSRSTTFRPKVFTQITRNLTMWIDARDPETGLYPTSYLARVGQRNENYQQLCRLLGNPKQLIVFERDIILSGGSKQTWTARGEYVGEALLVNWGDNSDEDTNFNIDLLFPDPLWYEPEYTSPTIASGGSATVVNTGDLWAENLVITLTASDTMVNPVVTNTTNGATFTLTTTINTGDSVVVECKYPRVKRTSNSANLIGAISNSGGRQFLTAERGNNTVTLACTSGAGNAVVKFFPPHF